MLGINSPFVYSCAAPSFTSGSRFLLPLTNTEVTQRHTDSAENTGISCTIVSVKRFNYNKNKSKSRKRKQTHKNSILRNCKPLQIMCLLQWEHNYQDRNAWH